MITITVPQKGTNIDSDINIKILEVWGPGLIAGFGPFRQATGQFDLVLVLRLCHPHNGDWIVR